GERFGVAFMALRSRRGADEIADASVSTKSKLGRMGGHIGALSLAGRFFSCAVCHRPEDQPVADGALPAALFSDIRHYQRLVWADGVFRQAVFRIVRIAVRRFDLPLLLSQEPGGWRDFDCGSFRDRLPDRLRHRALATVLAASSGGGRRIAVLDIVFDSRLRLDKYPATRWAAQ